MLRLIWKNAWRSRRRTVLTVLSVAMSLFLLSTMMCYVSSGEIGLNRAGGSLRLVTRHATSLTFFLPESYGDRLRAVPHVTQVQGCVWFGGMVEGREDLFSSNIACDLESIDTMWDEYRFEPRAMEKLRGEMRGALVAKRLLNRMREEVGWEIGKTVTLTSPIFKMPLELVLLGTIEGPDESILLFRRDYLEKARGQPGEVGYYWVRVDSAEHLSPVSEAIDRMFSNSEFETKTETEKAFLAGFMSMMGNVNQLVMNIGFAVVLTILMVAANTMGMTARERTTEHAVMRCLGFGRARIATLFLSESVLIALIGGVLGVGAATALYRPGRYDLMGMAPDFYMTPLTIAIGLGVALTVGFLAGVVPAVSASRRSIVDGLRRVD